MGNKMLIDATHPEETRVVVTRGNRVEEFDYESASRKQRRGNIYLAKVARIEPSLQAAFVNYGGNRHGFLAFSEIHPDYYQIPTAVREAMLREEAQEREARKHSPANGAERIASGGESANDESEPHSANDVRDEEAEAAGPASGEPGLDALGADPEALEGRDATPGGSGPLDDVASRETAAVPLEAVLPPVIYEEFAAAVEEARAAADEIPPGLEEIAADAEASLAEAGEQPSSSGTAHAGGDDLEKSAGGKSNWDGVPGDGEESGIVTVAETAPAPVEVVGSEDAMEEVPHRVKRRWRHYKIQEVIKRNQIVLIQVVKEERGTKGAALTTYLSLAGRYTVLMPNTASGGGISRKIVVPADRKRLKDIAQELEVPEGMGLIIRTAGASRTKAEIKRDFEYLLRLWENVRDLTLKSTAPCLVYEEGDLIKRSIRDLYNKEIDEILVAGDDAYREAKDFMRMLMPSHARNVQLYSEPEPLFTKYEIERQLNQMFSPVVTLRSGGYIVLNQTEALVAIDVNSGRATREYSIEDTALKTNIEASEEIARQIRLRDLAGLIVIDYIDMDERRNNRAVERRLKESLRHDRARIQVGHISHFGLLEMSRQRLRQGVVEVSTMPCPTCQGVGHIRSTESVALLILRSIEDHLRTQGAANLTATASPEAALYILNHKRAYLRDIETRYGVTIILAADEKAKGPHLALERGNEVSLPPEETRAVQMEPGEAAQAGEEALSSENEDRRSRRRRRRRREGTGEESRASAPDGPVELQVAEAHPEAEAADEEPLSSRASGPEELRETGGAFTLGRARANGGDEGEARRNRRRGRRGGRRHRGLDFGTGADSASGGVPGLGDQPVIDFHHPFSGESSFSPPVPATISEPVHLAPESAAGDPAASEVNGPEPAPGSAQEAGQAVQGAPAASSEALPVPGPEFADSSISESEAASPAPPALAPPPRQRAARAGPARKGWWQRSLG